MLAYLNSVSQQRHSLEFDIPFDRQQLADYLNLERTNMSKELGRMRDEGIIEFRKNHYYMFGNIIFRYCFQREKSMKS
ncbi:MAG: winged helix-turn-helix domain-containing protein [Flexilinea sp.]|nr:winged helix-turn-helix domain-containing protein [Flexilinea sp.]